MALLFDDIGRWWNGLWRGKSLALTVAFLTLVFFVRDSPVRSLATGR
jgi:hypothetical protein